jgi:hypothetical protein
VCSSDLSWNSTVDTVTMLRDGQLRNDSLIPGRGKRCFFSPKQEDWFQRLLSLPYDGYQDLLPCGTANEA